MKLKIAIWFFSVAVLIASGAGIYAGRKGLDRQECQRQLAYFEEMKAGETGYNIQSGIVSGCREEGNL